MAIVNGLCVLLLVITPDLSSGVSWAVHNQSIYAFIVFIDHFDDSSRNG